MPTKITVIFDNPASPEDFETGYAKLLAGTRALPGLQRIEAAKVWPKEDGTPTPAYRTLDLYFNDYDAASRAVSTAEAATLFSLVGELATGGFKALFADVQET